MTTANLSVGIRTDSARQSLRELKAWMQSEMKGVILSINDTALTNSVQAALKAKKFGISIDTSALKEDISKALGDVFKVNHRVNIDTAHLTGQVKAAVAAGTAGVKLGAPVVTAGAAAGGFTPEIKNAIIQTLTPALDELAKAAALVGGTARQIGAQPGRSKTTATSSFTHRDEETGETRSFRRKLDNPEQVLAGIQTENLVQRAAREQEEANRLAWSFRPDRTTLDAGLAGRRAALVASAPKIDARTLLGLQSRDEAKTLGAQIAAQFRDGVRNEMLRTRSATGIDPRTLLGIQSRDDAKALGSQIAAQMRDGVREQVLRARSASAIDTRTLLGLQSRDEAKTIGAQIAAQMRDGVREETLRAQSASAIDARTLLGLQSRDEAKTIGAQIAAQMRDGVREQTLRTRSASAIDARTLLGLQSRDEAKSMGAQIAAQMRDGVREEALRARSASAVDARTLLGLQSRDEAKSMGAQIAAQMRDGVRQESLRARSATGVDPRTLLGLPSRDSMQAFSNQLRAEMMEGLARTRLEMERFYEEQRFEASKRFTGQGVNIRAAAMTAREFGRDATEDFLGRKAGLLNHVNELGNYRRQVEGVKEGVDDAARAHRRLRDVMNDTHSAARGLAGSMGAIWVTWGSTVPIVAAAALGATMMATFKVGKDLQHQLAFVSALSGGAAVSMEQFGNAVRGSMVTTVEAAQGMRALAQNGLSVRESLIALPEILNLATVGEMSLAEAALGATGVMAAFNLQVTDLGRVSDVFAKAAAMSNTSVPAMVEAMKQASTVSDQYKVSIEETAASLSVMAKRNIEGSAAGTAFRNMMREVATPTDSAKKAIKALGLEFYDTSTGQLRPFIEILDEVRTKTIALNEQSRLEFLDKIFGERGGKAANAIVSDLDLFKKSLDDLKTKSDGFTKSVSNALTEMTEGKLKQLVTEFQLSVATAFNSSSSAVNLFLDRLRGAFASPEFKDGLQALASNVGRLSTLLLDHAATIGKLVVIYGAFKVGVALTEAALLRFGIAANTAAFAVGGLSISVRALTTTMTLGLSLLAPFALEWLLLRDHTDAAATAQNAFNEALKRQNETLDSSINRLRSENALLSRRNDLIRQGVSFEEASRRAQEDTDASGVKSAESRLDQERTKLQSMLKDLGERRGRSVRSGAIGFSLLDTEDTGALEAQITRQAETVARLQETFDKTALEAQEKRTRAANNDFGDRAKKQADFMRRMEDIGKANPKIDLKGIGFSLDDAMKGSREDFDRRLAEAEKTLNSRLEKRTLPDAKAESAARSSEMAQSRAVIADIRQEEQALKQNIRLNRELQKAKSDPATFAQESEKRVREESAKLLDFEYRMVERLRREKDRPSFTDADRTGIQTEIDRRTANLRLMDNELRKRAEIDGAKAERRADSIEDREARKAEAAARRLERAKTRSVVESVRQDEQELKQSIRLQREFEEAKYNSGTFGAYMTSLLSEQRAREVNAKLLDFEYRMVERLEQAKKRPLLSEADRENIQTEINRRSDNLDLMEKELAARAAIENWKAKRRTEDDDFKESKYLADLEIEDQDRLVTINKKYDLKVVDEVAAAKAEAILGTMAQHSKGIAEQEENVLRAQQARAELSAELMMASDEELVDAAERLTLADAQLQREQGILETRRERSRIASQRAGDLAAERAEQARTADYGMLKFWTDFRNHADSNAKQVYDIMKVTTDGMSNMVANFAITGKMKFREFAASVAAEATKMMTNRLILQLLNFAVGSTLTPSTPGVGAVNGSAGTGFGGSVPGMQTTFSANGNIMTDRGPLPLHKYDAGGVARSPQVSIFGEGRKPEAYVPLQDGRSIPVTVTGGGGGGETNVNTYITISGNGQAQVQSDASGQKAAQLGKLIEQKTMEVIDREKRPGGLLYAA